MSRPPMPRMSVRLQYRRQVLVGGRRIAWLSVRRNPRGSTPSLDPSVRTAWRRAPDHGKQQTKESPVALAAAGLEILPSSRALNPPESHRHAWRCQAQATESPLSWSQRLPPPRKRASRPKLLGAANSAQNRLPEGSRKANRPWENDSQPHECGPASAQTRDRRNLRADRARHLP